MLQQNIDEVDVGADKSEPWVWTWVAIELVHQMENGDSSLRVIVFRAGSPIPVLTMLALLCYPGEVQGLFS